MRPRLLTVAAFFAGTIALYFLFPLFEAPLPHGLSITREQARAAADEAGRELGIPIEQSWTVLSWEAAPILEEQYRHDPGLRKRAAEDLAVGPRIAGFRATYYRPGLEKFPPHGLVIVGVDGRILGARSFARAEDEGPHPTSEELQSRADQFVEAGLPGAPGPIFDSVRPNVLRTRTDHVFRYRVPTTFPTGDVVLYVNVFFTGDRFSGWQLVEEYGTGRAFRFEGGGGIATTLTFYAVTLSLLLLLIAIFLRKYHAGEVGVGVGTLLFGLAIFSFLMFDWAIGKEASVGVQFGGVDARMTALAQMAFKFLFLDIAVALAIFLSWSVGESFARERWGEKLASMDALLRRHPMNATVGNSILAGLLSAPALAASTLAVAAVPLLAGWAWPAEFRSLVPGSSGGAFTSVLIAIQEAIIYTPLAFLFVLAWFHRRRMTSVGVLIAIVLGPLLQVSMPPIEPTQQMMLFGFGGALAATVVFLAWDLLAAAIALFSSSLILSLVPLIRVSEADAMVAPMATLLIPTALLFGLGLAGSLTRKRIAYTYEDLAPHVRRIIERERVKAEIDAANRIQAALLPVEDPEVPGTIVASHYRAATEIGGDYFDFLHLDGGRIAIAFGDVAGHGLTSGIVMSMTKAALLVQVEHDSEPKAVMSTLNAIVLKTAPRRMLMTFFYGVLDPEEQTLRFCSAGHLDPYLYRAAAQTLVPLSSWGFPLGVKRREDFREEQVSFDGGDRLVLYSDGFIEALDDDGEPFGFDRFERVIREAGQRSAGEIKQALLASVKKFTRNRPPEDDQTLVVISFEEGARERKLA
jgi:hypothetical protein